MLKLFVSTLAAVISLATIQTLKADVVASWSFESLVLSPSYTNATTINNVAADTGSGTASGSHSTAGTAIYSTPVGNGSTKSLSANNWLVGDYYQFAASTVGYSGITISYDQTGSSTGPKDFQLQYSLDGTAFVNFGSSYVVFTNNTSANNSSSGLATSAWGSSTVQSAFTKTFDLSSISSLANDSTAAFRIVVASALSETGGTISAAGTDRIDNFILTGTAVPEPTTIALASLGGLSCLIAMRRKR